MIGLGDDLIDGGLQVAPDLKTPRLSRRLESFELAHPVRLQDVGAYRTDADPDRLGRQRRNTRGPGLVAQQALHALFGKAFLPAPDASPELAGLAHDRVGDHTRGAEQHDTGAPDVLLRRVRSRTSAAS